MVYILKVFEDFVCIEVPNKQVVKSTNRVEIILLVYIAKSINKQGGIFALLKFTNSEKVKKNLPFFGVPS